MRPTLFLLGPSDTEEQNPSTREWVEGIGWKVTAELSGVLPILPFVEQDMVLSANSRSVLVGVNEVKIRVPGEVNVFNLVGDADASPRLLQRIDDLARQIKPRRLFNPPRAVLGTSRSRLPKTLANIRDCIVPRTEAADPGNFSELRDACRRFDRWPMIIRARGHHGGQYMELLMDDSQLDKLAEETWPYKGVFLIEFVDCRMDDGLCHKIRVIMVDGAPYVRQCVYSDRWMIHGGSRKDLMNDDSGLRQREADLLAHLHDVGLGERAQLFDEINRRVGLDVFGIDFALVDGQVVIFEANACMRFFSQDGASKKPYGYLNRYKQELRRAIKKMLLQA